jgi:hypothetical protein
MVGGYVNGDMDSDEETLKSLELLSEEMGSGLGRHYLETAGGGGGSMVVPGSSCGTGQEEEGECDGASMLETESMLAIQAKYTTG